MLKSMMGVLSGMTDWLKDERHKLIYLEARPENIDEINDIMGRAGFIMLDDNLSPLSGHKAIVLFRHIRKAKYTNVFFANTKEFAYKLK